MTNPILPGETIGMLGSGQLGRMFTLAAKRMGYRVHVYSPDTDSPTGQVADLEVVGPYEDTDALAAFAQNVKVVTLEFENIPLAAVNAVERFAPLRPGGHVLHTTQHRLREKTALSQAGFPVTPFSPIYSREVLDGAIERLGCPAVLKTAGFGYDGKGQSKINTPQDVEVAYATLNGQDAILEAFIPFEREVSVVAARGLDGVFAAYDVVENQHRNHILDVSQAPANIAPAVSERAVEIAREVMDHLQVVGVLCVEFFLLPGGELLINELAPRPHNSGHWTIEGAVTSQFEQQLRAVCGLPLGATDTLRPTAMINLLGDLWSAGEPDWVAMSECSDVKLHLYGKRDARPGRKMGHLTASAPTTEAAVDKVRRAYSALSPALVNTPVR